MEIIIGIVAIVLLLGLLVGALWLLGLSFVYVAQLTDTQATVVPTGHLKFIVSGDEGNENLRYILANVDGYHLENGRLVEGNGTDTGSYASPPPQRNPITGPMWHWFGIRWVSITAPLLLRLHRFRMKEDRLYDQAQISEGTPLYQHIHQEPEREVTSFPWRFTRPTLVLEVELPGDGSEINVILYVTYQVVDPVTPVFVYGGDFVGQLDALVKGTFNSFCQQYTGPADGEHLTFEKFMELPKGEGSLMCDCLKGLNGRSAINELHRDPQKFVRQVVTGNVLETFGFRIAEISFQTFERAASTRDVSEAIQGEEIAKRHANARAEAGRGEGEFTRRSGEGEAQAASAIIQQLQSQGLSPAEAARIYEQTVHANARRRTAEAVGGDNSNIHTWIEGGGASPMIPTNSNGS